ncbi:MAG TPA: patatin-like phospholipase family protein, partial [Longimicrobiaceae bacterium]
EPEIVCGTSIGALVGGVYAAGKLAELAAWARALTPLDVAGLVDLGVGGRGPIAGRKLMGLYREHLGDPSIEELPRRFAAVATDLESGEEVWLRRGPLLTAIRASISIPGVFAPVLRDGRWLVDGGLVDPVPVSLCRAMGADVVLAVDLNSQATAHAPGRLQAAPTAARGQRVRTGLTRIFAGGDGAAAAPPAVIAAAVDIMQHRISRSRLAADPPDLLVAPRVAHLSMLEFTGGGPTVDEGCRVARRVIPALKRLLRREAEVAVGALAPPAVSPGEHPDA